MRAFILKNRAAVVYVSLALITFLAFGKVIRCGFINFDDPDYITENAHVQAGLTPEAVRWAFTTYHSANWHPLTWISLMADVQFFGLDPHLSHLINLLFHIANVLLLFYVLRLMTKTFWQSAFVAALFAIHPLHVESVAWVAERKDVLSTFFWMLTMISYYYYSQRPDIRKYLAALLLFALGLMAKPMLVTLPLVLLLLDYWPLGRFRTASIRRLFLEKIPFLILSALSSVVTYMAHQKWGGVGSIEAYPTGLRIGNALISYFSYMGKMFWPDRLAFFYPYPATLQLWQVLAAALLFTATTFAAVLWAKRYSYLIVGWLWYLVTLLPVLGLVQTGMQSRADRYTYIPLTGLFIMAAWGAPELLSGWRHRQKALAATAVIALSSFFAVTWIQTGYWRDSLTLNAHAIEVTANNYVAYNGLGMVYYTDSGNIRQAIMDYDMAISIDPEYPDAYFNRAIAFSRLGEQERANSDMVTAARLGFKVAQDFLRSAGISW